MSRSITFAVAASGLLASCVAHTAHLWIDQDRYDYEMAEPEHYQLPPGLVVELVAPEVLHGDPFHYPEHHSVSFRTLPMYRQVVLGTVVAEREAHGRQNRIEITLYGFGYAIAMSKVRRTAQIGLDYGVRGYVGTEVCMTQQRRQSERYNSETETGFSPGAARATEMYRRAVHRAFAQITRDAVTLYERECRGESTG